MSEPRPVLRGFDSARLVELRTGRGLSRADLGRLAGVPYNAIRRWETGATLPPLGMLARVASALEVDFEVFTAVDEDAATLAIYRTRKALVQADAAAALGMSMSTYSRLERGERALTDADVIGLAHILGISQDQVRAAWTRAHQRPHGTRP